MKLVLIFSLFIVAALAQDSSIYRLKSNDTVRLSVFQEPELAATEQLTVAGEVSFPLIGSVKLLGLSVSEAEELVTKKYDADYLVSPRITINVVNTADEVVSILGAVNNPGQQSIPANSTLDLVTAIASAGGLASHADPNRIELKRGDKTTTYRLEQLRSPDAAQVILRHADRVNIPASPFANKVVTILGEVAKPGAEPFPLVGDLSLDVLVATRGGFTESADPSRLTIKRGDNVFGGSLGTGLVLMPGDLITVPPSRFVGKTVVLTGSVGSAGPIKFPLNGKLDILTAINLAGGFDRLANRRKVTLIRMVGGEEKTFKLDCSAMEKGKVASVSLQPGDRVFVPERIF